MDKALRRQRLPHVEPQRLDLRIVLEQPRRLQGVLRTFEKVVEIPSPGVGRIELRRHTKWDFQLGEAASETRDRHHAVLPALAAYEHTGADVPVIPVHARRPGKVELLPYRFHGASPEAAAPADAAGADAAVAGAEPSLAL